MSIQLEIHREKACPLTMPVSEETKNLQPQLNTGINPALEGALNSLSRTAVIIDTVKKALTEMHPMDRLHLLLFIIFAASVVCFGVGIHLHMKELVIPSAVVGGLYLLGYSPAIFCPQ